MSEAMILAATEAQYQQYIHLRAQYIPISECAKRLNLDKTYVYQIEKKPAVSAAIQRHRAENRDIILAKKGITEPLILDSMGGVLKGMLDELGRRSFEEEKTKDLIDGILKVMQYLGTETTKALDRDADPKQVVNIAQVWNIINNQNTTQTSQQPAEVEVE